METLFITMLGLEERALGFFQKLDKPIIDNYLLLINNEYKKDKRVLKNLSLTEKYLKGIQKTIIETSYFDSLELVKNLNKYLQKNYINLKDSKIFLDISTFNRQNLLVLLYLLRKKYGVSKLTFYYTIPKYTNKEISKYAQNVSNIPFFSGVQSVDKNKLLILLVGFEFDRALYIWKKVEPSKTIIAIGDEPTDRKFLEINREIVSSLKNHFEAEEVNVSAKDPYKAKQDIEKSIKKNIQDYNIFISPMNTKLQTLGLYFAWEANPEIQILYSCPEEFGDWLTKGIQKTVSFDFIK
ncbi:MAG: hypothetical protein ISS16_04675 [Ignavibacteria bacterium]|nr:hypothetical protein [Ignavibacteria bacterium]